MAAETKSGAHTAKTHTRTSQSLKDKFKRKCKKNNTSEAQVLRDYMQAYVKKS